MPEFKPKVEIVGKKNQDKNKEAKPVDTGPDLALRRSTLAEVTLDNIGRPDDLVKVEVKDLWDCNHYRVNVFRKLKNNNIKMTDSYFVEIFDDGVVSSPPMDRRYIDDLLELRDFSLLRS